MRRLSIMLCLCCPAVALAANPPAPNLRQPVDYLAWFRAEYGKQLKGNAADHYLRACNAYVDDREARKVGRSAARHWSLEQQQTVRGWVEKQTRALEEFHRGADVRKCFFDGVAHEGTLAEITLPHLLNLRYVAEAGVARGKLRLSSGDVDGALDDFGAVLRASRHLELQATASSYLVGTILGLHVYGALYESPLVAEGRLEYDAMLSKLAKLDRTPPGVSMLIKAEQLQMYDELQRFAHDSNGDGLIESLSYPGRAPDSVEPPQDIVDLARLHDACLECYGQIAEARFPAALALKESCVPEAVESHAFRVLLGRLWRIEKHRRVRAARRHAARIVLRLHAWQAKHGSWPKTLKEAMQDESPIMRWDPFSEGEFVYELRGGQPWLYSRGADNEDDGGRTESTDAFGEKGDLVFWPLK